MDLFTPVVSRELQHPNFRAICDMQNGYNWDVLNDWARGFEDRDGKFIYEFQTTFETCFWELYIFAALKQYRYNIDFCYRSPDFVVTSAGGFVVEVAAALHAAGAVPEYDRTTEPTPSDLNEMNRRTMVRLCNSLDKKCRLYKRSYSNLNHVDRQPFVLALTAVDSPHFFLGAQRAIEAVLLGYYVDEERHAREGGELVGRELKSVLKDNGQEIDVGVFYQDAFRWLSAVIVNPCATWGKVRALSADPDPSIFFEALRFNPSGLHPYLVRARKSAYSETLLDGLRVYHNPLADIPLDPDIFRHRDVFQGYYDDGKGWIYEYREGLLSFRRVTTAV